MISLYIKRRMFVGALVGVLALAGFAGCSGAKNAAAATHDNTRDFSLRTLRDSLQAVADSYPAEIGIALLTDRGDTLTVNNEAKYPLMSVFKLHQAVALCRDFSDRGLSLDSVVTIPRAQLNPDTWSPMLKDRPEKEIKISVRELISYALQQSDNNASNYLFERLQPVADVDRDIATLIPRESFKLVASEEEMWSDHKLCYDNRTSPLGAAILINRLYTDSIVTTADRQFLCATLDGCQTGTDRIVAPLKGIEGIKIGHKTGSGFRDRGILSAHNDVAYVRLPDGRHYTLAVFVKDYNGTEQEAARAIARISALVFRTSSPVTGFAAELLNTLHANGIFDER